MAAHGARVLLNLVSTIVLARLLTPGDFGVVAMVLAVVGLVIVFRDLGLATATVQSRTLDDSRVSTLFWLNAFLGLSLGLVTLACAPLVAAAFREPRLVGITAAFGFVVFVEGLAVQHVGLLRRRMRFTALAASDVVSLALGVAVAVALAWRGMGYWALVWMRIVSISVRVLLLWVICDWRPERSFRWGEARGLVAFGTALTGSRLVRYLARNVDRLLVGGVIGSEALGLYGKAAGWLVAPVQQLSWTLARVSVPVLSRIQDDPARYRTYFRNGLAVIVAPSVALAGYLIVDAPAVVLLVLGDQWGDAVPIFRALAPLTVATLAFMGFHWCYVSLGRATRELRWEIAAAVATIASISVGLRWGAMGVALALSVCALALVVPGAAYAFAGSPVRMRDLAHVFLRPLAAATGAAGALYLSSPWLPATPLVAAVTLHVAAYLAVYVGLWLAMPGGTASARTLICLGRQRLRA